VFNAPNQKKMNTKDASKIAKNTMYLYVRMLFSMGVALYTSRVVLDLLGVEDFGVYNIVGGVVTLFAFFNSAMSSATQRFFSFELGRKDYDKLRNTFNATVNIHITIAVLVFILAETIGLWFVNNKLNLPIERMNTVQWVYHYSVLTFLVGVIKVPFNALIIAHERMAAYAYLSIVEVVLKLLIVYLLIIVNADKLILYAILVFAVTFLIASVYVVYCLKHFKESQYHFYYDSRLYRVLLSYSGWSLFGNIAAVAKGQGTNILLNVFFGPALNAAYGIGIQVQTAVNLFVINFQLAVNPQIIKTYASGEKERMFFLILQSSKLSFILMYILAVPLLFDTEYILSIWLKSVPIYTPNFVFLIIINLLIDSFSGPLMAGTQATGKVKYYQIIVGTLLFMNLPLSYLFLKFYKIPEFVFFISIFLSVLALGCRLFFLNRLIGFSFSIFVRKVLMRVLVVVLGSLIVPHLIMKNLHPGFIRLFILFVSSSVIILVLVYTIGIDKKETQFIKNLVLGKIKDKKER